MSPDGELGLLDTWTAALGAARPDRIVHLSHHVLGPDSDGEPWDVATAALLELAAGGRRAPVDALVACPACDAPVEVVVPVPDLLAVTPATAVVPVGNTSVPSVADMADVARLDAASARDRLAEACGVAQLAPEQRREALTALDGAHPLLAPAVAFQCPSCGAPAELDVDVVDLAWTALAERARVCLDDVVALAAAFGWSEAEVMAVPASRRAFYRRAVEGTSDGG